MELPVTLALTLTLSEAVRGKARRMCGADPSSAPVLSLSGSFRKLWASETPVALSPTLEGRSCHRRGRDQGGSVRQLQYTSVLEKGSMEILSCLS